MSRLFLIGWLQGLAAVVALGQTNMTAVPPPAAPPRLAIVTTADAANLASTISTELAGRPGVVLVPADHPVAADGLLFVTKDADAFHVRLTAVGSGVVVLDDRLDSATGVAETAKSAAQKIADAAPRLSGEPKTALAISVLNLHAQMATADSAALERKLTLLLENRLAAQPGFLVLERRHASDLLHERSLQPASRKLLPASYLLDGNISAPLPNTTDVGIYLRLRSATDPEIPIEVHGAVGDLPALVDQLIAGIQKAATPSAPSWSPEKEAREYLLEGIWGYQHKEYDIALEALDSADLLGETASDLPAVRVPILCRKVLGDADANLMYGGGSMADDPKPGAKIACLKRAMSDETRYEKDGGEAKLQVIDHYRTMDGRTGELHKMVDRIGSQLLAMLNRTNQPEVEDVRSAVRAFAGYDPLHGKLPGDWEIAIDFADDWATSKEEEIAYYHGIMTTYPFADFGAWRLNFQLSPEKFCARFIAAPEDRSAAYFAFFQDLTHDPVAAPLSLYYLATHAAADKKDAACHALYDYLWDQHEQLNASKHLTYILKYAWQLEKARGAKPADPKLVLLLHYYLQNDNSFTGLESGMWLPELFPAADAPGLLADLQGYEKRDARAQHNHVYHEMETAYADRFGQPAAAGPSLPALEITRFWYPKDLSRRLILGMGAICPVDDGLWLAGEADGDTAAGIAPQGVLYHVALDPAKPGVFVDPAAPLVAMQSSIQKVVAMPGALCLLARTRDEPQKTVLDRYDFAAKQWSEVELPGAAGLFLAGGEIYFTLAGLDFAHREGGLGRFDFKTANGVLLASSRRRPAQNQFDDCAEYRVENVFTGPGGKPCATVQFKNYCIKDTPGPWDRLTNAGLLTHAITEGPRTLLFGQGSFKNDGDAAVMIDPAKPAPELWLGPVTSLPEMTSPGTEKPPLPPLPEWAATSAWQHPADPDLRSGNYGFRKDELFALVTHGRQNGKVELLWYRRGKAEPVRIPLRFKMDDGAKTALKAVLSEGTNTFAMVAEPDKTPYVLMMTVVPQGICFKGLVQGFWFLPFGDIDAYLKKHA